MTNHLTSARARRGAIGRRRKFAKLVAWYRFAVHAYGLLEDIGLLVACCCRPRRALGRALAMALVVVANLITVYMFAAHLIWELRLLDIMGPAKLGVAQERNSQQTSNDSRFSKDLDGLRRHLTRAFALAHLLTWNLATLRVESILLDCGRYYELFHPRPSRIMERAGQQELAPSESGDSASGGESGHQSGAPPGSDICSAVEMGVAAERPETSGEFYRLAKRRIRLACWLPVANVLLVLGIICTFGPSSKRPKSVWQDDPIDDGRRADDLLGLARSSLGHAMDNFESFHLSVHTSFHPYAHQVDLQQPGGSDLGRKSSSNRQVSTASSALYCLMELFFYSIYQQGSRLWGASLISLVLNLHHRCLVAFNEHLEGLIGRSNRRPIRGRHVIRLVKRYDLLCLMHNRIERAFRWAIIQYYTFMFISCLIHIFSITEYTSAYVLSSPNYNTLVNVGSTSANFMQPATTSSSGSIASNNNNNISQSTTMSSLTNPRHLASNETLSRQPDSQQPPSFSMSAFLLRFISISLVTYSPCLIYHEAFKIESTSHKIERNFMLLTRRHGDHLAQSIEPNLFEPIYLSVGNYFNLGKRSASAFLGAIVTFSVMFIGENVTFLAGFQRAKCVHKVKIIFQLTRLVSFRAEN